MLLKQLIDDLVVSTNGSFTRLEILQRLNTFQNWMFGRNCTEMEVQGALTIAAEQTQPAFWSMALTAQGAIATETSYVPGDAIQVTSSNGAVYHYRVITPFTTSADAADTPTYVNDYCSQITAGQYAEELIEAVVYEAGVTWSAGALVLVGDQFYDAGVAATGGGCSGTIATDIVTYGMLPVQAISPQLGTEVIGTEAVPEYIELANTREVTEIGIKDGDNNYTTTYEPRIQQSPDPSIPCRVYTAGLPEGTTLSYTSYRWPSQLTAESSVLEVPVAHQEGLLKTLVHKAAEEANYGNSVYWAQLSEIQKGDWFNYINRSKTVSPRRRTTQVYNSLAG